nr:hypothetical protein [Candidatus Frankia alpina]
MTLISEPITLGVADAARAGVPVADAVGVEVAVHGGAGHVEQGGDRRDGVGAGVVELLGARGLLDGEAGPPTRPRARAAARPSRVLATMSSRWYSARTESMPNMARPSAVVVSMPCSTTCRPTPRSARTAPRVTRCSRDRPSRSRRVTFTVSPSRNSFITRSSSGRDAFAPDAMST